MDQLESLACPECKTNRLVSIDKQNAVCAGCGKDCNLDDLEQAKQALRRVQLRQLCRPPPISKKQKTNHNSEKREVVAPIPECKWDSLGLKTDCGSNFEIADELLLSIRSFPPEFSMKDSNEPQLPPSTSTSTTTSHERQSKKRNRLSSSSGLLDGPVFAGCTHQILPNHPAESTVVCSHCGLRKMCDHINTVVINRDYAGVCTACGIVVGDGMALFELGCLPGAPFHNRRGSYKIVYYWNEKLAQWSRKCPRPSEPILRAFLAEAKNVAAKLRPSEFTRKTIARICRTIGHPTTQEKWLMLFDILSEYPEFDGIRKFPVPSYHLLAKIQDCFRVVLPIWFQCKDIDITEDVKQYLKENPEESKSAEITKLLKPRSAAAAAKRRKSFPHNYMIHQFLRQLQLIFVDDPELSHCYDLHEPCHKHISQSIYFYQSMIWKHICETINCSAGDFGIDFSLSLQFSACSNIYIN